MNFEKKIKELLLKRNIIISVLCDETGISTATLHKIFNTNEASTKVLQKISKFFSVPMSYWFSDEEQVASSKPSASGVSNELSNSKEVEYLKQIIAEKDRYIKLLESRS